MSKYLKFIFERTAKLPYIRSVLNPFEGRTLKEKPHENNDYAKRDTSVR